MSSQLKIILSLVSAGVFLALIADPLRAQDASFSQFYNNPVYYNPAYTGSNPGLRARLNYRNQWQNLPNSYNNYSFTMDVAERNMPGAGGLGLLVVSDFDGIGSIRTTSATLTNSVRIQMRRKFVTQFGVSASFVHRSIDWNNFVFSDQIHPVYGIVNSSSSFQPPEFNTVNHPDFGFGILFKYFDSSDLFDDIVGSLAFSLQHVFQPDISFTGNGARLPMKLVVMGDLLFDYSRFARHYTMSFLDKMNPGFIIEQQGEMTNFLVGSNFYKSFIYSGLWLRSQHFTFANVRDLILLVGVNMPVADGSLMKVMYSYDYTISRMRRTVGATHEIFVVFELDGFNFFRNKSVATRMSSNEDIPRIGSLECSGF